MYLAVVLICTSLVAGDAEHHFICLLAICLSSLEKRLCLSSPIFKWVIRVFLSPMGTGPLLRV